MATISNTPRPGYVWDSTDNVWYPIGVGGHSHPDYITQATAISPTTVDAKGDLLVGSAADTISRLAVGADGSSIVADSSTSTGLRYQGNFAAGKNKIINGDMNIWQRGTSITVPIANNSYSGTDRFCFSRNGTSSVVTCSRQAFTPGTAPVAGYEGNYFMRFNQTTAGSSMTYNEIQYKTEDVTTFAGQTVTFSFWAKADSSRTLPQVVLIQNFGSGGSSQVNTNIMTNLALTTSWQRFTATVTLPSISGKTIGTSSFLEIDMQLFMNTTFTFDTWGWQLEAGSVATAFQTATGTLQGETSACQRYFARIVTGTSYTAVGAGVWYSTTGASFYVKLPTTMRTLPTVSRSGLAMVGLSAGANPVTSTNGYYAGLDTINIQTVATLGGGTNGFGSALIGNNSATDYIEVSAEL